MEPDKNIQRQNNTDKLESFSIIDRSTVLEVDIYEDMACDDIGNENDDEDDSTDDDDAILATLENEKQCRSAYTGSLTRNQKNS